MKKIIIITGTILLLLIFLIFLISSLKQPKSLTSPESPSISLIPTQYGSIKNNLKTINPKTINPTIAAFMALPLITPIEDNNTIYTDSTIPEKPAFTINDIKNGVVYKTENMEISYSPTLKKFILTRKTHLAQMEIDQWAREEDVLDQIDNPDYFIDLNQIIPTNAPVKQSIDKIATSESTETTKNLNLITDLFALLFNTPISSNTADYTSFDSSFSSLTPPTSLNPLTSPFSQITPIIALDNLVYYQQQDGPYDKYPLPQGCTIKNKGCGPTTAAMVLSSWVNPGFNPPKTVDYYQSQGFYIGCDGSTLQSIKYAFQNNGLKATPIVNLKYGVANQVVEVFKDYLRDGYTAIVLAEYAVNHPKCGKCGHFFWVIDVDANNNIWALDVFYGRRQNPQPFNENSLYPYPKYIAAFGVKK